MTSVMPCPQKPACGLKGTTSCCFVGAEILPLAYERQTLEIPIFLRSNYRMPCFTYLMQYQKMKRSRTASSSSTRAPDTLFSLRGVIQLTRSITQRGQASWRSQSASNLARPNHLSGAIYINRDRTRYQPRGRQTIPKLFPDQGKPKRISNLPLANQDHTNYIPILWKSPVISNPTKQAIFPLQPTPSIIIL